MHRVQEKKIWFLIQWNLMEIYSLQGLNRLEIEISCVLI